MHNDAARFVAKTRVPLVSHDSPLHQKLVWHCSAKLCRRRLPTLPAAGFARLRIWRQGKCHGIGIVQQMFFQQAI